MIAENVIERHDTPLRVAGRGALAGLGGLAVMGALMAVTKLAGAGDESGPPDRWEDAQPPAKFAHRFVEGVALRKVSVRRAPLLNNGMHFLYAPALGAWYGIARESLPGRPVEHGLRFGAVVWCARLTLLPTLRLGPPFWRWPLEKNVGDASIHLAFGLAVAGAYEALAQLGI